jgi:DNA ligase-4
MSAHHEEPAAVVDDDDDDDDENDDAVSLASAHSVASMASPEYEKANSLPFYMLCRRLELLWQQKRKKGRRITELEKKKCILPSALLKALEPESIFPLLRLLLPDIDNSRNCFMKEKLIAQAYCEAEGFAKGTTNSDMLYNFTDPHKVPHQVAGDLSLVVEHVLTQRIPTTPSKLTIGQINQLLNDLVSLSTTNRSTSTSHEWRREDPGATKEKPIKIKITTLRQQWLRKCMSKGLSPLEHKWLVRIMLKKLEFGIGWRSLLSWYSPYAMQLWNAHNSLKNLCDTLADPNYTLARQAEEEYQRQKQKQHGAATSYSRWQPPSQPAVLGNTVSPMLSNRVTFATCLTQLHGNHTEYLKQQTANNNGSSSYIPLALQFPTVSVELKVDGERMMIHVQGAGDADADSSSSSSGSGIVTMHTRNGKWYSQLYSPVLGPAIRRACLHKYNVNVILDGEVVSWDQGRQQLVPFGSNRTVANYRRTHLYAKGLLDPRDVNLHTSNDHNNNNNNNNNNNTSTNNDMRVMQTAEEVRFTKVDENDADAGKECWLQYIVFDILYVDGPDATKLLDDCGLFADDENHKPGSILHLSGFERKKILHRLILEQPTEVELVQAVVVRSNGICVSAQDYFSTTSTDHHNYNLDSTQTAIRGNIPNIQELDRQRRNGKNNAEIGRMRVQAIDKFYRTVVEIYRMEGIVLKDLAAPYIFGAESRSRRYWHKFKPDYEQNAVDMDVVILGAYFATGLRNSGRLSHFLVGCRDSEDHSTFMTLCNVNGGSVTHAQLDSILEKTGFQRATQDQNMQLGKWFQEEEHGKTLPNFISSRSLQREPEDRAGWKFSRNKNYPDLWIDPAGELLFSQVHFILCFANPFLTSFHYLFRFRRPHHLWTGIGSQCRVFRRRFVTVCQN